MLSLGHPLLKLTFPPRKTHVADLAALLRQQLLFPLGREEVLGDVLDEPCVPEARLRSAPLLVVVTHVQLHDASDRPIKVLWAIENV